MSGSQKTITNKNKKRIIYAGIFLGLHFAFFFLGVRNTSISSATLLANTGPLFTAVIAIINKEYLKGQSSSLQIGISALPEECDAAVVILGDMPDINSTLINQLIENYNPSDNKSIIIPTYKNKKGNPVLIDREFFPDILSIKGDKGAKDIIKVNKKYINEIPQKQSAIINDIDTKEDLAKYIKGSHDN